MVFYQTSILFLPVRIISNIPMEVYKRYASREHHVPLLGTDLQAEAGAAVKNAAHQLTEGIWLNLLLAQPGNIDTENITKASIYYESSKTNEEWLNIFPHAAYFNGEDSFFGNVLIMVYENPQTGKTCTTSFTKFGSITYENLILDARSRFWPSCENLLPMYQKSNVRRALAITNLKNYNRIANSAYGNYIMKLHWDETTAGNLANKMKLLTEQKPFNLGLQLLEMGLLQQQVVSSLVLDIVYDNTPFVSNENIIQENNTMVFLLGDQLDQLFDPLLEYSPEALEIVYKSPNQPTPITPHPLILAIIDELLTVQTNFTMGLVSFLQDFIIPLRIHILSAASNAGISKINQVFPPTIDEVTRINCILLDSLVKASKFGPVEVFKAMGIILPYFYKPFIRHEANLKNFSYRLNKFHEKNNEKIFENDQVNKGRYSLREVESIINGSLLELPKIKLILSRLYDAISLSKNYGTSDMKSIDIYYNSSIQVINAFGFEEISEKESKINRQRIFTPTGKILTEITSHWPAELHHGWLSRKVVGIYELQNVKPSNENEIIDILFIFSDHLLFLTIKDQEFTSKMISDRMRRKSSSREKIKMISISDMLMHALVNEKPLPEDLPKMEVNCWCDINEVVVSSYKGGENDEFLRFLIPTQAGFNENIPLGETQTPKASFSRNYKLLQREFNETKDVNDRSHIISELINKAKILNKTQPFHLFKTTNENSSLTLYSTAHEASVYGDEKCKSPFALYLNLSPRQLGHYFNIHNELFMILNASFINDHQIHIQGFCRVESFQLDEIIESIDLKSFILETVSKGFKSYINYYNEAVRHNLIQSYDSDISFYLKSFVNGEYSIPGVRNSMDDDSRSVMTKGSLMNVSMVHSIPEEYVAKYNMTSVRHPIGEKKRPLENSVPASQSKTALEQPTKKRKTAFFKKLFGGLFKSKGDNKLKSQSLKARSPDKTIVRENSQVSGRPLTTQPVPLHSKPSESKVVLEMRLPSKISTIGDSNAYPEVENLYQPMPLIKRHSQGNIPEIQAMRDPSSQENRLNNAEIAVTERPNQNIVISNSSTVPEVFAVHQKSEAPTRPTIVQQQNPPRQPASNSQYTVVKPKYHQTEIEDISIGSDVTAQPFRGPNSKTFRDSKSNFPRKHISLTEENVLVLDGLHSHSYRQKLNKLVESDFSTSHFNLDLYKDGESNWVTISRENSSLFNAEINALKEDANMDTEDVISVYSEHRTQSRNVSRSMDAADISQLYRQRIISENAPAGLGIAAGRSEVSSRIMPIKRDVSVQSLASVQSLSSVEIMEQFERDIDAKFGHLDVISEGEIDDGDVNEDDEIAGFDFNTTKKSDKEATSEATKENNRRISAISVSTEEDFYSPDEYTPEEMRASGNSNFIQQQFPGRRSTTNNSSISSEATIINENGQVRKSSEETQKLSQSVDLISKVLEGADSTSYLSELLEGTLRFNYEVDSSPEASKRNSLGPLSKSPKLSGVNSVSQSPSLAYLASYIRSGKTIRKDMDKIITDEGNKVVYTFK